MQESSIKGLKQFASLIFLLLCIVLVLVDYLVDVSPRIRKMEDFEAHMDEWHSSVNAARLQENPLGVHQGGIVVIHIKALAQDMLIDDVILSDDVKGFVAESPEDVKTVVEIYDELHDDDCLSLTAGSGRIESCRWDYYMTVVDLTSGNLVDIHTFRGGTIPTEVRVGRVNGHFTTFGESTHTHIINLDNPVIQAYISGEPPSSSEVYTYLFEMWAEGDK